MKVEELFPFEFIPKGSRIIIYGLGNLGLRYIEQNEITSWCEIVAVSDINEQTDLRYEYIRPQKIVEVKNCDYVVIAIKSFLVFKGLYDSFISEGIAEEKIVSYHKRISDFEMTIEEEKPVQEQKSEVTVKIIMDGGIGDAVMETAFYNRLISLDPKIVIDIVGAGFCSNVYSGKNNIRAIYMINDSVPTDEQYDIVFGYHWGIKVYYCNYDRLKRKSDILYKKVIENDEDDKYWRNYSKNKELYIRMKYDEIKGTSKIKLMGRGDVWSLSPDMMSIELNPEYEDVYKEYNLNKYITIAGGFDSRLGAYTNSWPTKIWPYEYYSEFIREFNMMYPEYKVVQIGDNHTTAIDGADLFLKGESLELVKYVLLGSSLHIDCEGGMMHLATALKTKCAVLFGPTPPSVLAYDDNINIYTDECISCFGVNTNWSTKCVLGDEIPRCMKSITPELVMSHIRGYIDELEK